MNPRTLFDFTDYIHTVASLNKLARGAGFHPCAASGMGGVTEMIAQMRRYGAFIVTDDLVTGGTVQKGGAWFQRRTFTVHIVARYQQGNETDRKQKAQICRELLRQLQSRLLRDEAMLSNHLAYIDLQAMPVADVGQYFLEGCTGLYFQINFDEPIDISYDAAEWLD